MQAESTYACSWAESSRFCFIGQNGTQNKLFIDWRKIEEKIVTVIWEVPPGR